MRKIVCLISLLVALGCKNDPKLPYLGNAVSIEGKTQYPRVADFSFTDQNGNSVTNATFKDKIYVADFIFLSCPTICPRMNTEMLKVNSAFKGNRDVAFLSHTIDPEHDTVDKLKAYADNIGAGKSWYFVTGNKDSIFNIATNSYFTMAYPDVKEPGGLVHGGGLLLIDKNRYIRGVYDGTDSKETGRLIQDIRILLKE